MISRERICMKGLRAIFSLMFSLTAVLAFAQQGLAPPVSTGPRQGSALYKLASLPPELQSRLKGEFGSWRIQEPTDLSGRTHERWESEKPLACPGIAVGQFENARTPSYAVLLVRQGHAYGAHNSSSSVLNPGSRRTR